MRMNTNFKRLIGGAALTVTALAGLTGAQPASASTTTLRRAEAAPIFASPKHDSQPKADEHAKGVSSAIVSERHQQIAERNRRKQDIVNERHQQVAERNHRKQTGDKQDIVNERHQQIAERNRRKQDIVNERHQQVAERNHRKQDKK